ncbi:MAG TPA: glycosyltransferase family 4 protein [Jatrophihabitans sp.]|jgi:phosphatidylinositol alpha-1,6-mannosyltransferase
MRTTLVVTNDFPPRQGGIQSYVHELTRRQPSGSIVVYASDHAGSAAFDADQPFPVVRHPTAMLLPTPAVRRRTAEVLRAHGASAVWFGASTPLGLLAPALRAAGAQRIVASTHGHETGWAMLPGARQILRRIGSGCDVVTYITKYTRSRIEGALGSHPCLEQLTPGVDIETFRTGVDGTAVRARFGLTDRPVIVCVSRLVRRKGQDRLIEAMPGVRRAVPDAALLLVGGGPYEKELRALAARQGLRDHVVFADGVALPELPGHYAAGDVFAMPCRTRRGGLDVEGLGMVYLEASAMGLPVVAGDSGGAPEAVREGETGFVVGGNDVDALTDRLITLLRDEPLRARMGSAGRAWVEQQWAWDGLAARLTDLLLA